MTIPISSFHKVGDGNVLLDPNQAVSDVGVRFWNSGTFTVDVTSIMLLGAGGDTPTPTVTPPGAPIATPTATPTPTGTPGAVTYTYDANGNLTADGGKCYEYNEANQLVKVKQCSDNQTIAEYVYDYNGIRLIKKNYTGGSLANTVISWTKSYETKAIGGTTQITNYYFANGQLIAKKNPDGTKQYYHTDHLGSATVITDQAGMVVEETKFGPWGEVFAGGTQSKYQYTGQEKDTETGLNYYGARYYDADIKRFTQPDPIIQNIYDPQSLNRYAYVRNNPMRYTDPTGYNWFSDAWKAVKNTVSNMVNAAKNTFAPKNVPGSSTAKLSNNSVFQQPITKSSNNSSGNGGGNSINVLGISSSGSNKTTYSNGDPFMQQVRENGHVDLNVSRGVGPGAGGSVKISKQGITQSISSGGPTFGKSASILFSTKPVKQNEISNSLTVTALGVTNQWSYDPTSPLDLDKYEYEAIGFGLGLGVEYDIEYTGKTIPYAPEPPSFRSKELKEIYGWE